MTSEDADISIKKTFFFVYVLKSPAGTKSSQENMLVWNTAFPSLSWFVGVFLGDGLSLSSSHSLSKQAEK